MSTTFLTFYIPRLFLFHIVVEDDKYDKNMLVLKYVFLSVLKSKVQAHLFSLIFHIYLTYVFAFNLK